MIIPLVLNYVDTVPITTSITYNSNDIKFSTSSMHVEFDISNDSDESPFLFNGSLNDNYYGAINYGFLNLDITGYDTDGSFLQTYTVQITCKLSSTNDNDGDLNSHTDFYPCNYLGYDNNERLLIPLVSYDTLTNISSAGWFGEFSSTFTIKLVETSTINSTPTYLTTTSTDTSVSWSAFNTDDNSASAYSGYESLTYNSVEYQKSVSYQNGYDDGYSAGQSSNVTYNGIFTTVFTSFESIMTTKVFGNLTIYQLIMFPIILGIILFIIKVVRG